MDPTNRACLIAVLCTFGAAAQTSAEAHFARGLLSLHSFEYDDAREAFVKAREQDPGFVLAYWGEALSFTEPIWFAQDVSSLWGAVLLIGLATAGHQAFSANLYTLPSDMFPQAAVGTVIGIGGTVGAIGGMFMAKFTGYILDATHSYATLFAIAASAYLVALLAIQLLSPRLARAENL